MASVLVIGGGLSGLSAAHTVYERGGNVTVLEKVSPPLSSSSALAFPSLLRLSPHGIQIPLSSLKPVR